MADDKVIYSMMRVGRIYPPNKASIARYFAGFFLWSQDWCAGAQWRG